jgi:decaprenylphospho-beta-D-ribofuranose 2-oxidase
MVPVMYPELGRWLAVKRRIDPEAVFTSDLGRRLGLVPPHGPV